MNFLDLLTKLGHVLGILRGDDTTTGLTTIGQQSSRLTTPILINSTTLITTEYDSTISPKFLSTLFSEEIGDHTVTGMTAKSEIDVTNSSGTDAPTTTMVTDDSTITTVTDPPTTTMVTDNSTTTTVTDAPTNTTVTDTPTTTTVTDAPTNTTVTDAPTNTTTPATQTSTETSPTGPTGSSESSTGSTTTEVSPTEKPRLSRGAVAGIVIGCLLLVAVIISAVVFFAKNRSSPEAQRLRV